MRNTSILLLLVLAAGCGGGASDSALTDTAGASKLRIWVTDAPFPFDFVESASVVIREVQIHYADDDRWDVVFSEPTEIDLVPLSNGVEMLLVEASPEPGTIDQVRLIVDAGEVVLAPEAMVRGSSHVFRTEDGNLHFPSGSETGIKVEVDNEIVVDTQLSADLLLDFDLARNFVFNGPVTHPPGVMRVLFTPVVRAVNVSTAGSIGVTVLSDDLTPGDFADDFPLEGATVRILDGSGDVVVTGSTGADGRAVVSVASGTYDVEIEASSHASASIPDVAVAPANLTDLGDVVLEAAGEVAGVVLSDGGTPGDDSDDVVVEGASVELREAGESGSPLAATTTDASGVWRFEGLAPGSYDVDASASGFGAGALTGLAAELAGMGHTIVLEALPQDLEGTVTAPQGVDVTTIEIRAVNSAGVTVATTSPAADGSYAIALFTGTYEIVFDDGAAAETVAVTLVGATPPPAPETLDVTLGATE